MVDFLEGARNEYARWKLREARLIDSLTELYDERRRLGEEIARLDQQIAYYDSLTRDMKKEIGGSASTTGKLLSSLRRA
jgi:chromosome segregation ATPase